MALGLAHVGAAQAQNVRLKSNVLYWATATPNMAFETTFGNRSKWTAELSLGYNPFTFKHNRKWKHVAVQPEVRRWIRAPYTGHFVGLNALYSHFNAGGIKLPFGLMPDLHHYRQQGNLAAVGLVYGYDWPLRSCHWNVETVVGLGYGFVRYDKFACTDHCASRTDRVTRSVFMPTKLAVNVSYTFGGRRDCRQVVPLEVVQPTSPAPAPVVLPTLHYVADNTGRAGELEHDNPVLQHISKYRPYTPDRILRKERGALYVHFALDKSTIDHHFRDNDSVLQRIVSITRDIMADSTSSVRIIQIVGLASVEGAEGHNRQLSAERAEALKRYIQHEVPEAQDSLFDCAAGGEAWTELRSQIDDDHSLPYRDEMLRIIDSEADPARRERRLKQLAGGKAYAHLRDRVLSDQRNSGYLRIYYDYVPDKAAADINRAIDLIHAERYAEALRLLLPHKADPRAKDALEVLRIKY